MILNEYALDEIEEIIDEVIQEMAHNQKLGIEESLTSICHRILRANAESVLTPAPNPNGSLQTVHPQHQPKPPSQASKKRRLKRYKANTHKSTQGNKNLHPKTHTPKNKRK